MNLITSLNNWYHVSYEDGFQTHYDQYQHNAMSFKQELINAAQSAIDFASSEKLSLFFSGGLESDLLLKSLIELKYKPNIFIFRYEDDINLYDVSYAITLCSVYNLPYKIIDFNLKKFFFNEAVEISDKAEIDKPRALPYCKFLELVDGVPILGRGEPNLIKENNQWIQRCHEYDVGRIKYAHSIGKKSIPEWFKWTPGLVISFLELNWIKNLISNRYTNETDIHGTKIIGYREAYPDLLFRNKKTGMEGLDGLVAEVEQHLYKKNQGFKYRGTHDRDVLVWYKELSGKNLLW